MQQEIQFETRLEYFGEYVPVRIEAAFSGDKLFRFSATVIMTGQEIIVDNVQSERIVAEAKSRRILAQQLRRKTRCR